MRTAILCWAIWAALPASGLENRTAWLFEQLAQGTVPTPKGRTRHEVGIAATHLGDTLSAQGSINVDLSFFEVRARASRRLFLGTGPGRRAALEPLQTTASVEIARYFASETNHFGRLGLELVELLPARQGWLGLRFHTGILETPRVPWTINLQISAHFPLDTAGTRILLGVDTRKMLLASGSQQFHLGGRFKWLHFAQDALPGRSEHFQMGLGPYVEWLHPLGSLSLEVTFRVWMDREILNNEVFYPSEFSPPNLSLAWRSRW